MTVSYRKRTTLWLSIVLLAAGMNAAQAAPSIDPTTGMAPLNTPSPIPPSTVVASQLATGKILWDTSHGIYLSYAPSGVFSGLKTLLENQGFTMTQSATGVTNLNLGAYDILVICAPSAWNSAYSSQEVAAIQSFVNAGGGLLILGDNPDTHTANLNPVAQAFGVTTGATYVSNLDLVINNFATQPIFNNIGSIYMRAAGSLTVAAPSVGGAWAPTGETMVSTATQKVVALGDVNTFDNTYMANDDNQDFALNVFSWLGQTTSLHVSGTVKKVRGKTVTCKNLTTSKSVTIDMTGNPSNWDCEAAGLHFSHHDKVRMIVDGLAK